MRRALRVAGILGAAWVFGLLVLRVGCILPSSEVVETAPSSSLRLEAVHEMSGREGCDGIVDYLIIRPRGGTVNRRPSISLMHGTGPWRLAWDGDSVVHMTYSDGNITFMDTLVQVERGGPRVHVIARRDGPHRNH